MHIACISAANVRHARAASTSTKACNLIQEIITGLPGCADVSVDIIRLVDHELRPCHGCGACYTSGRCADDPVFNALYERLVAADGLFIVSAHYAPIPAKLCMLLEKIEQLAFLPRFHDESCRSPLYGRPVGIIGHGGGTEDVLPWYRGPVLDTIANALSWPVEMRIVGVDVDWPNGVVFPVQSAKRDPAVVFPVQEYDWAEVRRRIEPLVVAALNTLG